MYKNQFGDIWGSYKVNLAHFPDPDAMKRADVTKLIL